MKLHRKLILIPLSLLLSSVVQAQELRLFEEAESDATQPGVAMAPEQAFAQGGGQPAYTLRSVSRFGDQYQATLVNRSGGTTTVRWQQGETSPVLNSGGFAVVAAGAASVSLLHPSGDACVNAAAVGVVCSAGDRSELRLVAAVPLASNGVAALQTTEQAIAQQQAGSPFNDSMGANPFVDPAINGQADPQVFINPFSGEAEVLPNISAEERTGRQQRQEARAARLRQFENSATINDADVPAGMQRVRTPFGDRLMPIRE